MRLPGWWRAALIVVVTLTLASITALLMTTTILTNRERSQAEHQCIIRLAVHLADPARDRGQPVQFGCEGMAEEKP